METDVILSVENLSSGFTVEKQNVAIVKDVSFQVHRGKTLAIVGESGCGKSVTVHTVMQLLPRSGKIFGGKVTYYKDGKGYELSSLEKYGKEMREIRGGEIGMVFQDPMASLNPVYTVGAQVATARWTKRRPAAAWWRCLQSWASPTPSAATTSTRTSSPAACASA